MWEKMIVNLETLFTKSSNPYDENRHFSNSPRVISKPKLLNPLTFLTGLLSGIGIADKPLTNMRESEGSGFANLT
jgi:hypothetical protein